MEAFIASIILFAGNFAPRGWAFCDGQILSIAQNTALFSLLGTTYGGNGQTTFALPDLRSRVPVHPGQGPGLSSVLLGQQGGTEQHTLTIDQMPAHRHRVRTANSAANSDTPNNRYLAKAKRSTGQQDVQIYSGQVSSMLHPQAIGIAGGSQPVPIRNPYLGLHFIIALEGIFPSRN